MSLSQAMDGTTLIPGLEFDASEWRVIDLTDVVNCNFVQNRPNPDPQQIKKTLVTCAEVVFITPVMKMVVLLISSAFETSGCFPEVVNFKERKKKTFHVIRTL